MSLYVNRLRYGFGAPTIGVSSGIVNMGYYDGIGFYDDDWQPEPEHDYSQDYFTIESLEDGNTISIQISSDAPSRITIYYSLDEGASWYYKNDYTFSWGLNKNEKLMLKCSDNTFSAKNTQYRYFASTKTYNVYGNIMSLLYGDNFVGQTTITSNTYVFNRMFLNSIYVVSVENLIIPASNVVGCYQNMFNGCTALVNAPSILPATTLATSCYQNMFYGCTSLVNAPELPATTLANQCYTQMFQNCTSLVVAPILPATTLTEYCYYYMFCGCTSLTTAPELPATTLVKRCYRQMFQGCTLINKITCLATNISAQDCIYLWLKDVSATGTFVKDSSMSSWPSGDSGIPSGWTIVDAA